MLRDLLQRLAFLTIVALSLSLLAYAGACALGYAPWLTMDLRFGDYVVPEAGMIVQLSLTGLAVTLCFFLPTNARVMALETSHRRFHIGMQDVARAYAVAHAADRTGVFTLSSEFDSIRERIAFLRDHPDLGELESSVLEVAAQMSHLSRELGQVYSDRNVARARDFLIQRQQEIEDFNTRLDHAKAVAAEMRGWLDRVEMDEAVAEAQLARLCDELADILPELDQTHEEPAQAEPAKLDETQDREDTLPQDDDRIVALLARRAAE
ncbi:DNA repair protein [Thalassococcus sp. BH17M4-6]|uniref:DNA repair protein n=1 Tax=Thalassococcus sp. BH17M4-6 TaxID=3413148 RepID=UPI003BF46F38